MNNRAKIFIVIFYAPIAMGYQIAFENPTYTKAEALRIQSRLIHDPVACVKKQFHPIQDIDCAVARHKFQTPEQVKIFLESTECSNFFDYLPEDPILLLSECSVEACELSRAHFTVAQVARNFFDDFMASELASKASSGTVDYVNLGSGTLFEDARIMSIAQQKGVTSLAIHLIDPLYTDYINFLAERDENSYNLNELEVAQLRESLPETYPLCTLPYFHALFRVFTDYLSALYGKGKITFYIYKNIEEYLALTKKSNKQPHVMFVADIAGDVQGNQKVYNAFSKLAEESFNKDSSLSFLGPWAMMYKDPSDRPIPAGFEDMRLPDVFNGIPVKASIKKFKSF